MSEHYSRRTVSASAWCPHCKRQTMHRIDDGRRGPCLECILPAGGGPAGPTGMFFCPPCGKVTLHEMTAGGWKKGSCIPCKAKAEQLELFARK